MNTLIMMVGLPRSGKSTIAKSFNFPIVNPDSIRLSVHGQRYYAEAEPMVWAIAMIMVKSLFGAGHTTVILDATNLSAKRRDEWKSKEWRRVFHLVDTPKEICIQRAIDCGYDDLIEVIERMDAAKEMDFVDDDI